MNLANKRVLITGATGGIGAELALALLEQGAHVLLTGRDHAALTRLSMKLTGDPERIGICVADLAKDSDRLALCSYASRWHGGIDVIINNAGVSDFALLSDQVAPEIQTALAINLLAPMDLCSQLIPHLEQRPEAHIVNIGSVFGSIGFAANTVYCATKFGLRGFSEALRRELADSNIKVHYFAPRATRTSFNTAAVEQLNGALRNTSDDPKVVAQAIVTALRSGRLEMVLGWPEKFFARLNALLPRLVDGALRQKLGTIQRFATRTVAASPPTSRGDRLEERKAI